MSKPLLIKLNDLLNTGELLSLVDKVYSAPQVLTEIGYSKKGQYSKIVKEYCLSNDIDISHWTANGSPPARLIQKECLCCGKLFNTEPRPVREQTTCSRACSNTYYRSGDNHPRYNKGKTLYRKEAIEHYGALCSRCGFDNLLALDVHHKDRNRENNSLENLEVICCNCHAIEHRSS